MTMLRKRLASAWQAQRLYILLAISIVLFVAVYVLFPAQSPTSSRYPTPLPTALPSLTRLTNDLSADTAPAWSPDGTRLVYYSLRNLRESTLRLMQADGSDSRQITALSSTPGQITWLPDGTRITLGMAGGIHTVNVDNGQIMRVISEQEIAALEFAWSPDMRTIVLISDRDGTPDVYLFRPSDSRMMRLTDNHGWTQNILWSPDGRLIAFHSTRDGNVAIYTLDVACAMQRGLDAACLARLTDTSAENREPAWSPADVRGKRIAFTSLRDGNPEIYLMDADGAHSMRLTKSQNVDWLPVWSPDGEYIAFLSSPDFESGVHNDIFIVRPDGSGLRRLTNDGLVNQITWSPDSRRIAFVTFRDSNLALCAPCNTEIYTVAVEN